MILRKLERFDAYSRKETFEYFPIDLQLGRSRDWPDLRSRTKKSGSRDLTWVSDLTSDQVEIVTQHVQLIKEQVLKILRRINKAH